MRSKFAWPEVSLRFRLLFPAMLLCLLAPYIKAQTSEPALMSTATTIQLGQPAVALNGPWKFHTGDSPRMAGSQTPLWAQPGFDDSGWQDYTIDPKHPALTAAQALQSEELPGWQSHGHPGYTGYAWYRSRLQAAPNIHSLALLMPQYFEDAYEVFINGRKIGGSGKLDGYHVVYLGGPQVFSIPAAALGSRQSVTLAIRFWSLRYEALPSLHNIEGGLRAVPLLGPRNLLQVFQRSLQEQTWKTLWPNWLLMVVYGAVGIVSLFLFFFSRNQREYLWAGISLTSGAVLIAASTISQQTTIPMQLVDVVHVIADVVTFFTLPLAAMYLLSVPKPLWRRINYLVLALFLFHDLGELGLYCGLLPPIAVVDRFVSQSFPLMISVFSLLLLAIAIDGVRTIGRKAWLPLAPGLVFACGVISSVLKVSSGRWLLVSFPLFVSVPLVVLVIFLLRFTEQQREHVRLVDDMRQAQEVQQVLIPEELPQVPGLTIESEYRPAREVGGDFFQIIPNGTDGSVLIVVGDVTGKGLQAGMLVALIVGVIRTMAMEKSSDPLRVLQALNRRLCGRGHAHATCLALRIASDGAATLANAGHLPPYLNGKELPMEGALPLGMVESAEFSMLQFQLSEGDRLILMSDGIAEAQDKHGQLFGFERIHELLQKPITAAEVATAAQNFGQEDDISVLSVTRTGTMKAALA